MLVVVGKWIVGYEQWTMGSGQWVFPTLQTYNRNTMTLPFAYCTLRISKCLFRTPKETPDWRTLGLVKPRYGHIVGLMNPRTGGSYDWSNPGLLNL